ncbi:MAG: hypothetical protein ACRC2T_11450 [Thermoguttaceae bacterium]
MRRSERHQKFKTEILLHRPKCASPLKWRARPAITADQNFGGTYIFVNSVNKSISKENVLQYAKNLIIGKAEMECHLVSIVDQNKDMIPGWKMEYNIPVFWHENSFCFFRSNFFSDDYMPRAVLSFNEWFNRCKEGDKINRESKKRHEEIQKLVDVQREKCSKLITTETGRLGLLAMLTSDEGKEQFGNDTYSYDKFRALPYEALHNYYVYLPAKEYPKMGGMPTWPIDKITKTEAEALGKLLTSNDVTVKSWAMYLIEAAHTRSLLPDLLKICHDKDQVPNLQFTYPVSNDPNAPPAKPRIYNFNVYRLIGKYGDEKTLETLKELQKDEKQSAEVKSDIQLACEDIQRNIAQHEREEHRNRIEPVSCFSW